MDRGIDWINPEMRETAIPARFWSGQSGGRIKRGAVLWRHS